MSLVEIFPQNPFQPTSRYVAKSNLPITIPWTNKPIAIGAPFSLLKHGKHCASPLKEAITGLDQATLIFHNSCRGKVNVATTTGSFNSLEHTDLSIEAEIGGSWAGASGRADYEEKVMNDCGNIQSSTRYDYQSGSITFNATPSLSKDAILLLKQSSNPHEEFRERFGEFYVGGYILGGTNATMLSGSVDFSYKSEDFEAEFEAHFLFFSASVSFDEHEVSSDFRGSISLAAFDSLSASQDSQSGNDAKAYSQISKSAEVNKSKGTQLVDRISKKVVAFSFQDGHVIRKEMCDEVCSSGLVSGILLLPYTGLRSYVASIMSHSK